MMGKHVGSAEIASDPMPPNFADPYVMPKPRDEWPPNAVERGFGDSHGKRVNELPANACKFTQPSICDLTG
jgi:cobalt-zinc-cadmium resistance protein CzcA